MSRQAFREKAGEIGFVKVSGIGGLCGVWMLMGRGSTGRWIAVWQEVYQEGGGEEEFGRAG